MTVNTVNITSGPYTGNDITVDFSYTFRIEAKTQISVYETDDLGVQTLLTVDTDYTVAGLGVDAGGTLTRVAGALPTGYTWYIRANYSLTQLSALRSQGGFFPDVHEDAFDKLTFLLQQQNDKLNRSFRLDDTIDIDGTFTLLKDAAERANLFLSFDASGNVTLSSGTGADAGLRADLADTDPTKGAALVSGIIQTVDTKVEAKTLSVVNERLYFAKGADGGLFKGVTGAAPGTYSDNAGAYYGTMFIPAGGDGSAAWVRVYSGSVNVKWFGAKGDGVTNDSAAVNTSIAYLTDLLGGELFFPATDNYYLFANALITAPIVIRGEGKSTIFSPSADGYLFVVDDDQIINKENSLFGVEFRDFYAIGGDKDLGLGGASGHPGLIDRTTLFDAGVIKMSNCDQFVIDNLYIKHFRREAINFSTKCREGVVSNVYIRYCGDTSDGVSSTAYPCINLTEIDPAADSHNNIFFSDIYLIFPLGIPILATATDTSPTNRVRNIAFDRVMIHGTISLLDGQLYNFTTQQKNLELVYIKNALHITFDKVRFLGAGYNTACVNIVNDIDPAKTSLVYFSSCVFDPHSDHGALVATQYPAINMDRSRISISGCVFNQQSLVIKETINSEVNFDSASIPSGQFASTKPDFNGLWEGYGTLKLTTNITPITVGGVFRWTGSSFFAHDSVSEKYIVLNVVSATASLADITASINTVAKYAGKMVFNTGTSKPVWALGATAASVWVDATGATAHTPV